jgi:hypothetical protein
MPWRALFPGRYAPVAAAARRRMRQPADRFMVTGESTAISGVTMGVYLFRNANVAAAGE